MTDEQKDRERVLKELSKGKDKDFIRILKDNLNRIIILAISVVYVFYGVFALSKRDTSIAEIIGNIATSLIVGIAISLCMRRDGLIDGRKTDEYKLAVKENLEIRNEVKPNLDKLNAFCNLKNTQELNNMKKDLIEECGLNYKAWKLGYYNDDKVLNKLNEEQKMVLNNIDKVKVQRISSTELLSDSPLMTDKQRKKYGRFGKSPNQFLREKTLSNILNSFLWSIVFGYYTLKPIIEEDTMATMLWNGFQLVMWISNGIIKYFDSKDFMNNEYRETHIVAKSAYLNEFKSMLNNNPKLISEFSDDIDIEKFIQEKESDDNGSKE